MKCAIRMFLSDITHKYEANTSLLVLGIYSYLRVETFSVRFITGG